MHFLWQLQLLALNKKKINNYLILNFSKVHY